ncbi:shikimate dehydrogenase [Thermoanaerobacterium sp. DL9XJH110]|uniref:shikimate dehydrogenase n=1 Tax=Thermoanaerobacterium sp. DL9XJH110 TaxID=3386643 RepID=UPI003BB4BAD8
MRIPSANTKIVGLFGNPLGHTLSPLMQNTAFEICGIDFIYVPFQIKPEDLERAVRNMPVYNFCGANVTMPYKTEVIKYIDEIDELAKAIGAVNTLVVRDNKIIGYNTDGPGFIRSLRNERGIDPRNASFLIIGAGGAARGLAVTLAFEGAKHIFITNRTFEKAEALTRDVNNILNGVAEALPLESHELSRAAESCQVIINTTSVGMYPNTEEMPVAETILRPDLLVCDVIYNPLKTRLLNTAEKKGCSILTGVGMLVNQGAEAFRLWTGLKPPLGSMFEVVNRNLKRDSRECIND